MNITPEQKFYFGKPLYAPIELDTADALAYLYGASSSPIYLDSFCIKCGNSSTFCQTNWAPDDFQVKMEIHPSPPELVEDYFNNNPIIQVRFNCARNCNHFLLFTFYFYFLDSSDIPYKINCIKIGQYPSSRDLVSNDLKKYRKILPEQLFSEFQLAVGLHSHGVGVGSIVYLRRIIETFFIKNAEYQAENESGWNKDQYQQARVTEKNRHP